MLLYYMIFFRKFYCKLIILLFGKYFSVWALLYLPNRTDAVKKEICVKIVLKRISGRSENQELEEAKAVIPRPHKPLLNDDAYEKNEPF